MRTTRSLAISASTLACSIFLAGGLAGCGGGGSGGEPATTPTPTASAALTAATLYRVDGTGTNLASLSNQKVGHGVWTTLAGAQNLPGNFGAHLFLSKVANPAAADLLAVTNPLSIKLERGANTFYFFGNGDDALGGAFGFGMNVWFDDAAATAPALSAFASTSAGTGAFAVNVTTGCTGAFDMSCVAAAGSLVRNGSPKVTLTAFQITGVGGAAASGSCTDKIGGTNTSPTLVTAPDGICDTTGTFTLTVE